MVSNGRKTIYGQENWLTVLLEEISALPEGNHTIAIDGRCAAGKTTLAEILADRLDARVVHMDDFFLPTNLRTQERLEEPGGNVHYERFLEEIIPHLNEGSAFFYQRFDCSRMEPGEHRKLPAARFTIVEGAYSCHPILGSYMSFRVFMDVESKTQEDRIRERNGQERLLVFREKWIPMEEKYITEFQIKEKADFVLTNKNVLR